MKIIALRFILLFNVLFSFSQEVEPKYHLYVKLKKSIESDNQQILNLKKDFQLSFNKEDKISHLINSNIYKISHSLTKNDILHFINSIKKLDDFIYYDLVSATPIKPPHDIAPVTPDFTSNQTYLGPDPGVNANYAWSVGANGTGINIRVLEYGLNTNHEEFDHKNAMIAPGVTIHTDAPEWITEHGTATAGMIFSDNGSYGTTGIAFNANEYVLYPEWTLEYDYDRVQAVSNAINNSSAGDIIVYEMQNEDYAPAEVNPLIWDLTKTATDNGIVVVAAAGNGNLDLDDVTYNEYMNLGDSGAIIVGGGYDSLSHNASGGTNYGSRVNVQGWSYAYSTGNYSASATLINNDINQSYGTFSATSAATAMVGGCVVALQSYYFGLTGNYLTSIEMRNLLIDTGIPQGSGGHVGPLPDLEAAINSINQTLSTNENALSGFMMYPNPVQNKLHINQVNKSSYKLSIHNMLGTEIFSEYFNQSNSKIDLTFLKSGIYFVNVSNSNTQIIKKIIKK